MEEENCLSDPNCESQNIASDDSESQEEDEYSFSNMDISSLVEDKSVSDINSETSSTIENTTNDDSESQEKDEYSFSYPDCFILLFSITTTLFDVGSDVYTAVNHYKHGNITWFAFTILFVLAPCLIYWFYILIGIVMERGNLEITADCLMNALTTLIPGGPVIGYDFS